MTSAPPTWLRIRKHAETRIEELRTSLESAKSDQVSELQSEIRVWRQVLDLPSTLSPEDIGAGPAGYS